MSEVKYQGDEIKILEYPQPACVIVEEKINKSVVVRSPKDAIAIIESLSRFLQEFYKEETYEDE